MVNPRDPQRGDECLCIDQPGCQNEDYARGAMPGMQLEARR